MKVRYIGWLIIIALITNDNNFVVSNDRTWPQNWRMFKVLFAYFITVLCDIPWSYRVFKIWCLCNVKNKVLRSFFFAEAPITGSSCLDMSQIWLMPQLDANDYEYVSHVWCETDYRLHNIKAIVSHQTL